jgi:urocanate hydratase
MKMIQNTEISNAMAIQLGKIFPELPQMPKFVDGIRRAPKRKFVLSKKETELALKNALR